VRSGAIRNQIEKLTLDVEHDASVVVNESIINWKKDLYKNLLKSIREHIDTEDIDINIIKSSLRKVLNSIEYPELKYSGKLPDSLKKTGVLKSSEAEEFLDESRNYVNDLKRRIFNDIDAHLKKLYATLKGTDPSVKIFSNYKEKVEEIEKLLKNKELSLAEFSKFIKDMESVK